MEQAVIKPPKNITKIDELDDEIDRLFLMIIENLTASLAEKNEEKNV